MAIFSRIKTWVSGETLYASDLNSEFNNLLTNTKPESIEDYSADVTTMRLTTDPGGSGSESLATSLAEELRRIRYVINRIVGKTYWYEAPVSSIESLGTGFPTGSILAYGGTSAPTGWLLCDGSAVSRTTYAALFAVIGETAGEGNNTTTFNVPDLRGRFLRGRDGGAGRDPDAAGRTAMATGGNTGDAVFSVQDDEFEAHNHGVTDPGHTHSMSTQSTTAGSQANAANYTVPGETTSSNTTGITINNSGGSTETRPKNVNVNYIIKF